MQLKAVAYVGSNMIPKKDKKHWLWKAASISFLVMIILSAIWWFSPWGQIWLLKWDILKFSRRLAHNNSGILVNPAESFAKAGDFKKAINLAEKVTDYIYTDDICQLIQNTTKFIGDEAAISFLLNKAKQVKEREFFPDSKARELCQIALAIAKIGGTQKAYELVNQARELVINIKDDTRKNLVLSKISQTAAELSIVSNDVSFLEMAHKIIDNDIKYMSFIKAEALEQIAGLIASSGDTDKALLFLIHGTRTAEGIKFDRNRAYAVRCLSLPVTKIGSPLKAFSFLEQQLQVAEELKDDYLKALVLEGIAQALAQIGDTTRVLKFLENVHHISCEINKSFYQAMPLNEIAIAYAKMGEREKAVVVLKHLLQNAEKMDNSHDKDQTLRRISQSIAKISEAMNDIKFLEQALQIAKGIVNNNFRFEVLLQIASTSVKICRTTSDTVFLKIANYAVENAPQNIEYYYSQHMKPKTEVLEDIVNTSINLYKATNNNAFLEEALQAAENLSDIAYMRILCNIALIAAKMGDREKALTLLQQARQICLKNLPYVNLQEIAQVLIEIEGREEVSLFIELLIQIAEKMTSSDEKVICFKNIALTLAKIGDSKRSSNFLEAAYQAAKDVKYSKTGLFIEIAEAAAIIGKTFKAYKILQQAHTIAERDFSFFYKERHKAIAISAAKVGNWHQARHIALSFKDDYAKVSTLSSILEIWALRKN